MPKKKNDFVSLLVLGAIFLIIWLIYTGTIWYLFALVIIAVVGYYGIKVFFAKEKKEEISAYDTIEDEPFSPLPPPQPTIIKEKEIIKQIVMIPCEYCGSLMLQTAIFCPNCGA